MGAAHRLGGPRGRQCGRPGTSRSRWRRRGRACGAGGGRSRGGPPRRIGKRPPVGGDVKWPFNCRAAPAPRRIDIVPISREYFRAIDEKTLMLAHQAEKQEPPVLRRAFYGLPSTHYIGPPCRGTS